MMPNIENVNEALDQAEKIVENLQKKMIDIRGRYHNSYGYEKHKLRTELENVIGEYFARRFDRDELKLLLGQLIKEEKS